MRKILLTILIAMVASGGLAGKVEAKYEEDGATWWSVEELLNSSEPPQHLKEMFLNYRFMISEVNLAKETIKVIYLDEDPMLKMMGIDEKQNLNQILISWYEKYQNQVIDFYDGIYHQKKTDDIHVMYEGGPNLYLTGEVAPGVEVEIGVAGADLRANKNYMINYAVFAGSFNGKGEAHYRDCVTREDYIEGEPCRLMFSEEKGMGYLPVRENVVEPEVEPGVEPEEPGAEPEVIEPEVIEPAEFIQPDEPVVAEEPKMTESEVVALENKPAVLEPVNLIVSMARPVTTTREITNNQEKTNENLALYTNVSDNGGDDLIEVPDLMAGCAKEKIVEFPWWLILLLILGDALIMWWFWPEKRKNEQKI